MALIPTLLLYGFAPCPLLEPGELDADTPRAVWDLLSRDPRPRRVPGGPTALEFAQQRGVATSNGGTNFAGVAMIDPKTQPYLLSNPPMGAMGERAPGLLGELQLNYPLPAALEGLELTQMVSVGLNGTGQIDIKHHYHMVTGMLLLQGEKIWALRPPGDSDCGGPPGKSYAGEFGAAAGTPCENPFDVCAYYAEHDAPAPACVQRPGETLILPDGWFHGTCNTAEWTIGHGAQGRRSRLLLPICHHCRRASQPPVQQPYATSVDAVLGASDALLMEALSIRTGTASAPGGSNLYMIGSVGMVVEQAVKGLLLSFVLGSEIFLNDGIRSPTCHVLNLPSGTTWRQAAPALWSRLREPHRVHLFAPLRSSVSSTTGSEQVARVRLVHRSSQEVEERQLSHLHAAVWMGSAMLDVSTEAAYRRALVCSASLPVSHPEYRP